MQDPSLHQNLTTKGTSWPRASVPQCLLSRIQTFLFYSLLYSLSTSFYSPRIQPIILHSTLLISWIVLEVPVVGRSASILSTIQSILLYSTVFYSLSSSLYLSTSPEFEPSRHPFTGTVLTSSTCPQRLNYPDHHFTETLKPLKRESSYT